MAHNVAAIGYDEDAEEVYVEFLNSGLYAYSGVPLPVFQEFETAPKQGLIRESDSQAGITPRTPHPPHQGRARRRQAPPLLLARLQPPRAQRLSMRRLEPYPVSARA